MIVKLLIFLTILFLPLYNYRIRLFGLPTNYIDLLIGLTVLVWLIKVIYVWFNQKVSYDDRFLPFRIEKRVKGKSVAVERRKNQILKKHFSKLDVRLGTYLILTSVFIVSGLISVITSSSPLNALGDFKSLIILPILFAFVVYQEYKDKIRKEDFSVFNSADLGFNFSLTSLFIAALWVSLYGLWQWVSGTNPIAPLEAAQGRITSIFNNPNFVGLFIGPVLSLMVAFSLSSNGKKRWVGLLLSAPLLVAMALTFSQGAWFGVAAIMLLFLIFKLRRNLKWELIVKSLGLLLVGVYITLFVYLVNNISGFTPSYRNIYPRPDPSTLTIRLCLWEGTIQALKDHPWFGLGLSGFKSIYPSYQTCDTEKLPYPHNVLLNFWVELGLIGLVSFVVLTALIIYDLLLSRSWVGVGLAGGFIYWFVHGQVDVPYFKNDLAVLYWVLIAVALLYLFGRSFKKELA